MATVSEFSRPLSIEGLTPDKTRTETVTATEEECAALSRRFGLSGLSGFTARLNIRRVPGRAAIRVWGEFEAEAVQICAVSLQDVPTEIRGSFETYFTEQEDARREIDLSEDALDAAEMVHNGMIDLGEVAAQYMALELDPYPRAPGVSLPAQAAGAGPAEKHNPFKVLETLLTKK